LKLIAEHFGSQRKSLWRHLKPELQGGRDDSTGRRDRVGRNLKHLVTLIDEFKAMGIAFVSLGEGIDCTTPAGTLQLHILAALAEFERARIQERVRAGLARARAQGIRLGRPPRQIDPARLATVAGLPEREAARRLGVPRSTLQRFLALNRIR
jgi:DNA invertase Pin-like site-specific DNA recombinase